MLWGKKVGRGRKEEDEEKEEEEGEKDRAWKAGRELRFQKEG